MILTSSFSGDVDTAKMHGTTLSSVSSLTVNPEPIVQFNIQTPSATSREMHKNKYLALHILTPSYESVKLARNFSLGSRYINSEAKSKANGENISTTPFGIIDNSEWELFEDVIKSDRPDALHLSSDLHLPILTKHSERILVCEKYKVFNVYNHEIWTCKVKDILVNVPDEDRTGGLLYFNRKFHHVGDALAEITKKD
jgi:flavin reductase (DIM6/NTAB) family NADH-FMN oxidoreductase RutF